MDASLRGTLARSAVMAPKVTLRTLAAKLVLLLLVGCSASASRPDLADGGAGASSTGAGASAGGSATTTDGAGGISSTTTGMGGAVTGVGGGTTTTTGQVNAGSGGMPTTTVSTTEGSSTTGSAGTSGGGVDPRDVYFQDWPEGSDPRVVGKLLAEVFDAEVPEESKHYKVACVWYGALMMSGLLGEQALLDNLVGKYEAYAGTWAELLAGQGHVDENVFGIVPLEISRQTTNLPYLAEGLALADHQQANIETQKRFAIDDMFMITALQVQAFRASGDTKYVDLAASVMVEYLDRLQQDDGLFHHHEDFFHKWARGNGWFAVGMAELLRELPETHQDHAGIRTGYEKMMQGLLSYQLSDGVGVGLWQQIVDSSDERNWSETSGSAMFTYALVSGVREGWLDVDIYGPRARAAWLALVNKLTPGGLVEDVSDWAYLPSSHEGGPSYEGDEENYYFERPKLTGDNHGQAPMLWSAWALATTRAE